MFQKQAKSEFHIRKIIPKIQELQPIEYLDLIPPKEEKYLTNSEDESENQRHTFFVKKSRVKSRKLSKDKDQIRTNPIINDLIINKEENTVDDEQDGRGLEAADDLFKQHNQLKKYMLAFSLDIEGVAFEGTKMFRFLFFLDKFCN